MKRFFSVIFVLVLLLCQDVNACQTKTDTSEQLNPPAPVAEQQNTADKSPQPHQKQTSVENENIIRDQSATMIERVSKLAKKTNWALFISFVATIFAGLAWLANREAIKVTRNASRAELQPYIEVRKIKRFSTGTSRGSTSEPWTHFNFTFVNLYIENTGVTPLYDVNVSGILVIDDKSTEVEISNVPKGMVYKGSPLDLFVSGTIYFPKGGAEVFSFDKIELFLKIKFKDMLSDRKERVVKVKMQGTSCMQSGLTVKSIEETKQS